MTTMNFSRIALACVFLALQGAALAQPGPTSDARAQYQQDRADCLTGRTAEDRATCLKEAVNAYNEAKHGRLDDGPTQYQLNEQKRCERLPDEDRHDCVARMQGQGTTSGSVSSGGIYRELVTREVGAPAAPQPDSPAKAVEPKE